jgi:hypothetical protein
MVINADRVNYIIHLVENAITAARRDPEIAAALAEFGYTNQKLQNGITFLASAKMYSIDIISSNETKVLYHQELLLAWDRADQQFSVHRRLAKTALKHSPKLVELLGLSGPKYCSLSGWLLQARQFYTNALLSTDAQIALIRFNLTRNKLEDGQTLVREVAELENIMTENPESLYETLRIDGTLDQLVNWFDDFVDISQIALDKKPHLLTKLGIQPLLWKTR